MEGKAQASWRWSVLAWFELQGHTVDAKPLASGLRSITKHMAEVSFTLQGKDAVVSPQENSSTWLLPPQSLGAGTHHPCIGIWLKDGKNGYIESGGSKQSYFLSEHGGKGLSLGLDLLTSQMGVIPYLHNRAILRTNKHRLSKD